MKQSKNQSKRDLEISEEDFFSNCDEKLDNLQSILNSLENLRKCGETIDYVYPNPTQKSDLLSPAQLEVCAVDRRDSSYYLDDPDFSRGHVQRSSRCADVLSRYFTRPCLDISRFVLDKLKVGSDDSIDRRACEADSDSGSLDSVSNTSKGSLNLICENSSENISPSLNLEADSGSDHVTDEEAINEFRKRIERLKKLTMIRKHLLAQSELLSGPIVCKPKKKFSLKVYSHKKRMANRKVYLLKCQKKRFRREPPGLVITKMGYVKRKRFLLVCRVRTYPPITYVNHFMRARSQIKPMSFMKQFQVAFCYASKSFNNFVSKYIRIITIMTICYAFVMDSVKVAPIDDLGYEAIHSKFLEKVEQLGLPYYQLNGFFLPDDDNITYPYY